MPHIYTCERLKRYDYARDMTRVQLLARISSRSRWSIFIHIQSSYCAFLPSIVLDLRRDITLSLRYIPTLSFRRCSEKSIVDYPEPRVNFYLIIATLWETDVIGEAAATAANRSARRITEVTEGDSAIINMPSAGSHKSRVIEFSTSITGRRSARPQEIGRYGDVSWTES